MRRKKLEKPFVRWLRGIRTRTHKRRAQSVGKENGFVDRVRTGGAGARHALRIDAYVRTYVIDGRIDMESLTE